MILKISATPVGFSFALAVCLASTLASATSFSSFVQFEDTQDSLIRGDGYPGRMKLLNHRGSAVCVFFRYKNDKGEVLRLSKVGNKIPAGRQDLSVTGPGENARSVEMAVNSTTQDRCGSLGESDSRAMLVIRAGEVRSGGGFEVDARSWSGNSRDITVNIR